MLGKSNPNMLTQPPAYNGLHPGGRPALLLSETQRELIIKFAKTGHSVNAIADLLGIDRITLSENEGFSTLYKKHYAEACSRVWHRQFEILENNTGNQAATMAIWLGKQFLGQADKVEEKQIQIRINVGSDYAQRYLLGKIQDPELEDIGELPGLPAPGPGLPALTDSDKE